MALRDYYLLQARLTRGGKSVWRVNLELSPEELQAIGHAVAQWALLDHTAKEYAELLCAKANMTVPEDVYSYQSRTRCRALKSIVDIALKDHEDHAAALSVVTRVADMPGDRHDIIHGIFQWDAADRSKLKLHSIKSRKSGDPGKLRSRPVHVQWLQRFSDRVSALTAELMNVHGIDIEPFAEPRTPGKRVPASRHRDAEAALEKLLNQATRQARKPPQPASQGSTRRKR